MILELFLPEKIKNRRIISQKILGISIQDNVIYGASIYAKTSKTIIQSLTSCPIESSEGKLANEAISDTLQRCFPQINKYDQVCISIPASVVVFKELLVPFTDTEKIRLVLEYEIENMLPFSVDEAITDFIITKKNIEQKTSQILVAAVRKNDIDHYLGQFTTAGIDPDCITIDLFSLYNLFLNIEEYRSLQHGVALVDIGLNSTKIVFLQNGEFKLTRTIQRGIETVSKNISDELNISQQEILQKFHTAGLNYSGNEEFHRSTQKHFGTLLNDVQFTLNSFSLKLEYQEGIQKILFVGKCIEIKNFIAFSGELLQIPCQIFDTKKLLKEKWIADKVVTQPASWNNFTIALGNTLPAPDLEIFNLRRKEFLKVNDRLSVKQLIFATVILGLLFSFLMIRGYSHLSYLKEIVHKIEIREKRRLQNIFPKDKLPKKPTLQNLVKESNKILQESNTLWAPFTKNRLQPLVFIDEITNIIQKKKFTDVFIANVSIALQKDRTPIIEVEGYFRTSPGQPLWENFGLFKKRFEESPLLVLADEIDEAPAEDRGIRFVAKLKPR